jgi:phosphoribosylformimino-5-aminoimidazole carboxamide ribotide isomerase
VIVYPAIDLAGGECVRLRQGDFDAKTVYARDPLERARAFQREGAAWLHVVDLDGARDGKAAQTETILAIARETAMNVQVGGGVRDAEQIETLLSGGVDRVVFGSVAVEAPDRACAWLGRFGADRLVLALDVRVEDGVPFPATRGWTAASEMPLWDWLEAYRDSGLAHVLVTDIARDGTFAGPNVDLYREIVRRFPDVELLASGGVSGLADVHALGRVPVAGVVVGKALYEGRLTLAEALAC